MTEIIFILKSVDYLVTLYGISLGLTESQYISRLLVERGPIAVLLYNVIFSFLIGYLYENIENKYAKKAIVVFAISILFAICYNITLILIDYE